MEVGESSGEGLSAERTGVMPAPPFLKTPTMESMQTA